MSFRRIFRRLAAVIASLAAVGTCGVSAQTDNLAQIAGTWNNHGGDNMIITPDQLGGWDAFLGAAGQGNISLSTYKGSNIKVETKNLTCFFRATILESGSRMNWQLRASRGDCSSIEGYFDIVRKSAPTFDFNICNHTSRTIKFATVGKRPNSESITLKEGWWTVRPSACTSSGSYVQGRLQYYAEQLNNAKAWGGVGHGHCVSRDSFKEVLSSHQCGSDEHIGDFNEIYVDGSDISVDLNE